jgi:glycosyltransferase involved in cell wall biosynthesis
MPREKELTIGLRATNGYPGRPSEGDTLEESPKIAILLCTMQGAHYLEEQLDSIIRQTHRSWTVWTSDDGSDDGTLSILYDYQEKLGKDRLSIRDGPAQGYVANFLSLACHADIKADYYAYADQDDVWEANKLARALECLRGLPKHMPALYCSRTRYVDVNNKEIGLSRPYAKRPDFANAMVQSIGGGNTMVFNEAARQLFRIAGENIRVVSHDWWAYMVVSGCGGKVIFDPTPLVRYRQHDNNLVGAENSWLGGFERAKMLIGGRFKLWNDINLLALQSIRDHLTPDNKNRLDEFSRGRKTGLLSRLISIKRSGVYRQTKLGNFGLFLACIFKKI